MPGTFMSIFAASAGGASIREAWRGFKSWKATRAEKPEWERNAGFITDRKLWWAETAVRTMFWGWLAAVATLGVWLTWASYQTY